jgi:hypothetical protein
VRKYSAAAMNDNIFTENKKAGLVDPPSRLFSMKMIA